VTIYANATIVGGETVIGAGSTIGASVFLTQSVPPNSLVTYEKTDIKVTTKKHGTKTDFQI
jgi:serine O-acetyltransferase